MAVTLRDFMTTENVLTISPDLSLGDAARELHSRNVGAAVVMTDAGLAGIFTERDLLRAVAEGVAPGDGRVGDYMTRDPFTLPPGHSPSEAAQIMTERRFRHIPVLDGDELVGIVSIRDLVGAGLQMPVDDSFHGSDFP
jgi:CBS domain-containing protein